MSAWTEQMPIYVTRESASGQVGALYLAAWVQILLMLLVLVNAVGWSVYGIVELISKVV